VLLYQLLFDPGWISNLWVMCDYITLPRVTKKQHLEKAFDDHGAGGEVEIWCWFQTCNLPMMSFPKWNPGACQHVPQLSS
jgi:hypothetical protein